MRVKLDNGKEYFIRVNHTSIVVSREEDFPGFCAEAFSYETHPDKRITDWWFQDAEVQKEWGAQ